MFMSNRDCSTGTVIRQSPDDPRIHQHHRADCKKLSCDRCGPKKARWYQRAIAREAEAKGLTRFVTFTLDPKRAGRPEDSVDYIRVSWNKMRTYLKRKFTSHVHFILILELQKSGMAHLHVLVDRYIEKEWLDATWRAVGGGFTFIKYVDVHRVSAYLTKYVTKELLMAIPSKKKRITASRGIQLNEKRKPTGWWWDRKPIQKHHDFAIKSRQLIANTSSDDTGLRSFESTDPPDGPRPRSLTFSLPFVDLSSGRPGGRR
jgi:hypothetical protein